MTALAITKKDALASTAEIKREVGTAKKARIRILRMIARSIDADEYKIAGFTEIATWLEHVGIETSVSHFLRLLHNVRALKDVPTATLESIPEGSQHILARIPEKARTRALIEKAATQRPSEFRATVAKTVYHEPNGDEPWATYSRSMPRGIYDELIAAEEKIARVLDLDIGKDSPMRPTNLKTVIEAIAALVNLTPEEHLKTEIEGS